MNGEGFESGCVYVERFDCCGLRDLVRREKDVTLGGNQTRERGFREREREKLGADARMMNKNE